MRKSLILLLLALGALLAVPLACVGESGASTVPAEGVELRAYAIPKGFESEVRSAVRSALGSDETRVGSVSVAPGGQLLVVAPPGVQRGIAAFIKGLEGLDSPPAVPAGVSMTYWFVLGRPRAADAPAVPDGGALRELQPALQQIEITHGPTAFRLLERVQLASMGDSHARTSGRFARIQQRATAVNDEIVATIEVTLHSHNLGSQVVLQPGQFLVLAQTGYDPKSPAPPGAGGDDWTLYYVIRSELAE